jgi:hypothetical protein
MPDVKAVEIQAELRQIRTMADGSVNIVLNLPEYCIPQAKVMMDWLKGLVHCVIEFERKSDTKKPRKTDRKQASRDVSATY